MVKSLYGSPPAVPERATSHEAIAELAVAWALTSAPGTSVRILTTNYDLLLERALHRLSPSIVDPDVLLGTSEVIDQEGERTRVHWEFGIGCSFGGVVATPATNHAWLREPDKSPKKRSSIRVIHLHGVLTPEDSEGHIVATSSDYYRDEASHTVARRLVSRSLREDTCLFVGTSLADPLVLSHLHNAAPLRYGGAVDYQSLQSDRSGLKPPYEPHWRVPSVPLAAVLFSRESFPWAVLGGLSDETKRSLENQYAAMWRQLRLSVVWSDFYSQPYQFLREIAFSRRQLADQRYFQKSWNQKERPSEAKVESSRIGLKSASYGSRIDAWAQKFLKECLLPGRLSIVDGDLDAAPYVAQQRRIREFLQQYRDRCIEHLMNVQDPQIVDEEWKLDLWIRSPRKHALLRVASTQYEFITPPKKSVPYPLEWQSHLPAVRAFVNGQMSEDSGVGRWRYYLAIPVRQTPEVPSLDASDAKRSRKVWGDFPVGALVLASSLDVDRTLLSRRPLEKRREIKTLLQTAGNEVVSFGPDD